MQQLTLTFNISLPDFTELLHVLGSVGLVLIVLEGTLDLEITRPSIQTIKKSILMSIFPLFVVTFLIALLFMIFLNVDMRIALINAIPFCIISSAIAIPSARNLNPLHKNFITYESSFSDIVGVTFFNFITLNSVYDFGTFGGFFLELILIVAISIASTILLSFILSKLNHHVKFGPILITVILIYSITKLFHLPGLIFIVVFGLTLGNVERVTALIKYDKINPEKLAKEVGYFKDLVTEATFLIRSIFFIIFGFLVQTSDLFDLSTLPWALIIVSSILIVRAVALRVINLNVFPLLFIAPRGLITILLFVSILPMEKMELVNNALVLQVIVISVLLMMFGVIYFRDQKSTNQTEHLM